MSSADAGTASDAFETPPKVITEVVHPRIRGDTVMAAKASTEEPREEIGEEPGCRSLKAGRSIGAAAANTARTIVAGVSAAPKSIAVVTPSAH